MQNNRYWNSLNPHLTDEVWHTVRERRIPGPTFFHETINCERYVQVILQQFYPELTDEERLYGWFQQDSATAHTARMSTQALSDVFRGRNISNGTWPAHSPDLNPCDFFFCGSLRDKVYNINHLSEELKKIFIGKLQIFLPNSFKELIRTSSASARNVYVKMDSILNTSCNL
jgi:hypothetical protein